MHIQTDDDGLVELFDADVVPAADERTCDRSDYRLEFSANNLAQCKREVGEAYIAKYDAFHRREADTESATEPDS